MGSNSPWRFPLAASSKGFTLLETIIALTIMVLAFASILSVEDGGISAAERTRQMNTVSMLARNKMIEMEYRIQGKSFDEVKKDDTGNYEKPYEDYRWKAEIKEIKFPNLVAAASQAATAGGSSSGATAGGGNSGAAGAGQGGDMTEMLGKLVTNFLSKAMREVTVTIFWKRPAGEQSFSVSTYWVDLNHEFELQQ